MGWTQVTTFILTTILFSYFNLSTSWPMDFTSLFLSKIKTKLLITYFITCCKDSKEWIMWGLAGSQESMRWILTPVTTQKNVKYIIDRTTTCYFWTFNSIQTRMVWVFTWTTADICSALCCFTWWFTCWLLQYKLYTTNIQIKSISTNKSTGLLLCISLLIS